MIYECDAAGAELKAVQAAWKSLAIRWELTWSEKTELLPQGLEDTSSPPLDTEHRMRILVEIGYRLDFADDAELCDWLRCPSALSNFYTPLELMTGGIADLRRFRLLVEQGGAA